MDTYTKTMITIITVCVVVVTLLLVGSLIFEGHDHDDEHDYGYVEELYEKLEYINHRVDELEERLEEQPTCEPSQQCRIPVSVEPEEEEALRYILGYLDTLAHRKQTGDPTVQAEMEVVRKMMMAQ